MTMYYNNGFTANQSSFVDVDSNVGQVNTLTFANKVASVKTAVGATKMVSGHVSLVQPFKVDCADTCQDVTLNESLQIRWNMRYGNSQSLSALRTEVLRVLDVAIATYGAEKGLVPPAIATFES